MVHIYTDGGARGNPGPAAVGVYIESERGIVIAQFGKYIGETTNNVAEYQAVIAAYEWLLAHSEVVAKTDKISFFLDSELVVSQLNGIYKIKNAMLKTLIIDIRKKQMQLSCPVTYTHVPRAHNKEADRQVNNALDNARTLPYNK